LLGFKVFTAAVWKYIDRSGKDPSVTWRAFLKDRPSEIVAIDFFSDRRDGMGFEEAPVRIAALRGGP